MLGKDKIREEMNSTFDELYENTLKGAKLIQIMKVASSKAAGESNEQIIKEDLASSLRAFRKLAEKEDSGINENNYVHTFISTVVNTSIDTIKYVVSSENNGVAYDKKELLNGLKILYNEIEKEL